MRPLRIYVDTSVVGGCLDEEFREASVRLFDKCRAGEAILIISDTMLGELDGAPNAVRRTLDSLPPGRVEYVFLDAVSNRLAFEYLDKKVVPRKMRSDAQHIALATVAKADVVVSWNFKHIVNLDRIRAFNAVNLGGGYPPLDIRSPMEIWSDENEDI